MQISDEVDSILLSTMGPLSKRRDIQYNVQCLTEKHLSGMETTIVVVAFVLSGILGGTLSAVGADLWDSIKQVFGRLRKQATPDVQYRIVLEIRESTANYSLQFLYTVDLTVDDNDINIDMFVSEARTELMKVEAIKPSTTTGLRGQKIIRCILSNKALRKRKMIRFLFDGKTMTRELE